MSDSKGLVSRRFLIQGVDVAVQARVWWDNRDGSCFVDAKGKKFLVTHDIYPICEVYVGGRWLHLLAHREPSLATVLQRLPRADVKIDPKALAATVMHETHRRRINARNP